MNSPGRGYPFEIIKWPFVRIVALDRPRPKLTAYRPHTVADLCRVNTYCLRIGVGTSGISGIEDWANYDSENFFYSTLMVGKRLHEPPLAFLDISDLNLRGPESRQAVDP